jgi:hypothetical protein
MHYLTRYEIRVKRNKLILYSSFSAYILLFAIGILFYSCKSGNFFIMDDIVRYAPPYDSSSPEVIGGYATKDSIHFIFAKPNPKFIASLKTLNTLSGK